MNSEQWKRVQTLFKEIVDLEPDTRQLRLESVKTESPLLYEELRSLLAADSLETSLLDGFAIEHVDLSGLVPLEGVQVGHFQIEKQIGSGGMGSVYLAKRVEGGFDQTVALKLIKYGMGTIQAIRHFEEERSILARLQHPHIARLIDGGITEEDRPWFAMEYVEGIPISQYCRENKVTLYERLSLFLMITSAVKYAHKNLIVHGDLKPDNILVSMQDDKPTIKLLDFGVARLIETGKEDAKTLHAFTAEYASPEQLDKQPVTTTSDIYSMGVILYELFTGTRPYKINDQSIQDFFNKIRQSSPVLPSKVRTEDVQATHQKDLAGDLDNICLKAISVNPEQRYETAEQLADDVQSYLNHQPVTASPGTRAYRARKFIKRHTVGVFAAATILVILISGITAFAWQYQVAATERDRAQKEAETSRQVASFLQGLFEVSDPSISRGDTLTAFTMLERGAEQVETELAGNPELLAEMLDILGVVYINLFDFQKAEEMFTRSEGYKRQIYPEDHISLSVNYHHLGNVQIQNGNFEAANSSISAALHIRRANLRQNHPDIASTLQLLGFLNHRQGNFEKAEELYSEALAIYEEQSSDDPDNAMESASLNNSLGMIFLATARYEEAAELFQDAVSYIQTNLGDDHPRLINYLANMGNVNTALGNSEEAERYFIQSVETARKTHGNHHPHTANALIYYSNFLFHQRDYLAVEQISREALQIYTDFYDDDNPVIPVIINNLANSLDNQGKLTEAEELHRVALARRIELFGSESHHVAQSYGNIAATLRNKEKYDLALEYYHRALEIEVVVYGENHPETAYSSIAIAYVHKLTGENKKAEEYYLRGYQIFRDLFGDDNHETRDALDRVTRFYEDTGQPEKIETLNQ
ncbi:MAG: serine/threonine-protein kinase [Balneolaceae bacterium]|nr:MAG: serine/threonine-protein kinase [Balneolaceae bacterium]